MGRQEWGSPRSVGQQRSAMGLTLHWPEVSEAVSATAGPAHSGAQGEVGRRLPQHQPFPLWLLTLLRSPDLSLHRRASSPPTIFTWTFSPAPRPCPGDLQSPGPLRLEPPFLSTHPHLAFFPSTPPEPPALSAETPVTHAERGAARSSARMLGSEAFPRLLLRPLPRAERRRLPVPTGPLPTPSSQATKLCSALRPHPCFPPWTPFHFQTPGHVSSRCFLTGATIIPRPGSPNSSPF